MFIHPEDLKPLIGQGRQFEELLYDLVVAEAFRHGIPPHEVDWDPRTTVGDGGRDIIVKLGHNDNTCRFVPQKPSIWSAKSGKNGTLPASLSSEVTASNHDKLRKHLLDGKSYVWCVLHPMSKDERDALKDKSNELAQEFGFDPALIEFRWEDTLHTVLNDHPGVIAKHLPQVAERMNGAISLREWEREDRRGFAVEWVDFSGRSQVRDRIRQHLRARSEANVLHLAGLSGIGKTRTVLEACRGQTDLSRVLYIPRYADFSETLLRHFTRNEHLSALVVIDEVRLEELEGFCSRIGDFASRLRFVTIGPAQRNSPGRRLDRMEILVLTEPDTSTGVLEVIRRAGADLSNPVQESIAAFSAHDLRLALLLVEASKKFSEFRELPIHDGIGVWNRIVKLFSGQINNAEDFQKYYRYLTIGIDIGFRGEHQRELEYLATQFNLPLERLDEVIPAAVKCGLGVGSASSVETSHFFEASPRALAGHLFRQFVWPGLERRIDDFLKNLPDRLLRRFIERCQECTGDERAQMEVAVQSFFSNVLGERDLLQLVDRQRSRLFAAWAELDSRHGLAWLRDAVNSASDEHLAALDGQPDGSGGWRGRRQIVWLCEWLACFAEYFWDCEAILFRLAQVETEPAIGNNSTQTWQMMFLPTLGNTEVPFPDRSSHLLRRLQDANEITLPLIFSAAVGTLKYFPGRIAPPAIVGGRLVPRPWFPRSSQELIQLQRDMGRRTLQTISQFRPPLRSQALRLLIEQLGEFLRHDLFDEVHSSLAPVVQDEELRQMLRVKLNQMIGIQSIQQKARPNSEGSLLERLRQWDAELAPDDLSARIKDLTAQDYWSVMQRVEEATIHD